MNLQVLQSMSLTAESLKKQAEVAAQKVYKHLSDPALSLDDRWKLFRDLSNGGLLKTRRYGCGYVDQMHDARELTLYNDFYVERYQTVSYVDLYERSIGRDWSNVDQWREHVLCEEACKGYDSFVFDW